MKRDNEKMNSKEFVREITKISGGQNIQEITGGICVLTTKDKYYVFISSEDKRALPWLYIGSSQVLDKIKKQLWTELEDVRNEDATRNTR